MTLSYLRNSSSFKTQLKYSQFCEVFPLAPPFISHTCVHTQNNVRLMFSTEPCTYLCLSPYQTAVCQYGCLWPPYTMSFLRIGTRSHSSPYPYYPERHLAHGRYLISDCWIKRMDQHSHIYKTLDLGTTECEVLSKKKKKKRAVCYIWHFC